MPGKPNALRTNLSTRPFYNERAVRFWLLVAALVVALATVFNVWRILHYSGSNTELMSQATRNEQRAAELRTQATKLRGSIDPKQLETVSVAAREANDLIDRRTFSWTQLFNLFEMTLPENVRFTSVTPSTDQQRRILLTVTVVARSVDDVNHFMENLDATGAFSQLTPVQERRDEEGQIESTLQAVYHPKPAATPAPEAAR